MTIVYRAFCLACEHTTLAKVDREISNSGPGVYRSANGQICLKCEKCGDTKHAIKQS
jgi:hypothetical protein